MASSLNLITQSSINIWVNYSKFSFLLTLKICVYTESDGGLFWQGQSSDKAPSATAGGKGQVKRITCI